jgi:hypothetical protein
VPLLWVDHRSNTSTQVTGTTSSKTIS